MGNRWESAVIPRIQDRETAAAALLPLLVRCEPRRTVMVHFFMGADGTVGAPYESVEFLFGRQGRMRVIPAHRRFGSSDPAALVAEQLARTVGQAVYVHCSDGLNSVSVALFRNTEAKLVTADSSEFAQVMIGVGLPFTNSDDLIDSFYESESAVHSYYLVRNGVTLPWPEPAP